MSPSTMVRAQMLSELEEIILYKQNADQPDRQQSIRRTWMKRFVIKCHFLALIHNVVQDYRDVSLMSKYGSACSKFDL